jgi:hypothetical protein
MTCSLFKLNSGIGATLCHSCSVIIKTGELVNRFLCDDCIEFHQNSRTVCNWGVWFNKHGVSRRKMELRTLPELTDSHLNNIIKYQDSRGVPNTPFIIRELAYRQERPECSKGENRNKFVIRYISPIIRFFGKHILKRTVTNII